MSLNRWLPRALFVGLIIVGITLPAVGGHRQTTAQFQQAIDAVLRDAGYSVTHRTNSWKGGRITGATVTVAHHPACAKPIMVTPHSIEGVPPTASDRNLRYILNNVEREKPFPVRMLWEVAWLELRAAASIGRIPKPRRYLLAVDDPTACLLLTDPKWAHVWDGGAT